MKTLDLSVKKISMYGAFSALAMELIALISFVPLKGRLLTYHIFELLTPTLNLRYLNFRLLYESNNQTGLIVNYLDLAFYLLFAAGTLFYIRSKGKEKRLLRFSYSVILMVKAIGLLSLIHNLMKGLGVQLTAENSVLFLFLAICNILFWGYVSYYMLRKLSVDVEIDKKVIKYQDGDRTKYVQTNKAQRFAHHIFDLILSVIICSKFVMIVFQAPLIFLSELVSERFAMYIMVIIIRLIYLTSFEAIFGATPMKFLTESRVLTREGEKIGFKIALLRTLTRHVPFEAFSYASEGNGWHDNWNHTMVVKEKQQGVNTAKYLWILPAFALIGGLSYVGYELVDKHQGFLYQKEVHEANIADLKNKLEHIDENYIVEIKDIARYYSSDSYYLRPDSIVGSQIYFNIFSTEDSYPTAKQVELASNSAMNKISEVVVSKEELSKCYTEDYRSHKKRKRRGYSFFGDDKKYEIVKMFEVDVPHIICRGTGGLSGNGMYMHMTNDGSEGTLVAIENIEGDLEWETEVPQVLVTANDKHQRTFTLEANNFERGVLYKYKLVVVDQSGKEHKYLMEQINLDEKFKQIFEGHEYY